ncbi:peptidase M4 family protein [Paenibacillus mucilaginosus]|nr:peptidase M4 family protein [Paenibacillus mucilaginosus]
MQQAGVHEGEPVLIPWEENATMNGRTVSTLVLSALFVSALTGTGSAEAIAGKKVLKNEKGEIHTIHGELGTLKGARAQERAADALTKIKADYGIGDVSREFRLKKTMTEGKRAHTRFDRLLNGIPVYGEQLIVHESDGSLTGVTGKYEPLTPTAAEASITASEALQKAVEHTGYKGPLSVPASSALTYLPQGDQAVLTYQVSVCYLAGEAPGDWTIFVDAGDGSIVSALNRAQELAAKGYGLDGTQKKIQTLAKGSGTYVLEDRTKLLSLGSAIYTYTFNNGSLAQTYVSDKDNVWDSEAQKAAVDAHYYAGLVYDFYLNVLGRNSYDGRGASIISGVHYSKGYNNAFWSGSLGQMVYGDGDGVHMSSLAGGLDVVAHELTHAVTEYTSGLIYQGQSGALNESWSDAMAAAIENRNWLIGEDIWTPGVPGDALRYMDQPELGDQPGHMRDYYYADLNDDNGGVHTNSGIPNKAFYHFATAIGSRVNAGKIWYSASLNYMAPNTDFSGARAATLAACRDAYGEQSREYTALQAAWTAVGVN